MTQLNWLKTLTNSRRQGFQVFPLDDVNADPFAEEYDVPANCQTFAHVWQTSHSAWDALDASATVVNSRDLFAMETSLLAALQRLLQPVTHVAVVRGSSRGWKSPNDWAYLMNLPRQGEHTSSVQLLAHMPTPQNDLIMAEHIFNAPLPPSYRQFLSITNGLGIGANELSFICGAGPARANWTKVMLNLWMECEGYHEVAAFWRAFQGGNAYERVIDREQNRDTFRSDETQVVPFAYTYEYWGFDCLQRNVAREYPIILWDHEMRESRERFPDFTTWFEREVFGYLFGE